MKSKSIFVLKVFTTKELVPTYCYNTYSGDVCEDDEDDEYEYEKEIGHFSSIRKALKYAFDKKFVPENIRIYEFETDNPKGTRRLFKLYYPERCSSLLGRTHWGDEYSNKHHKHCYCTIKDDGSIYTYYCYYGHYQI